MGRIKVSLVVGLLSFGMILCSFAATGQTKDLVKNLDSGETFDTIRAAVDDSDTKAGHTIVIYPSEDFFDGVQVTTDGLTVQARDFTNKPVISAETSNIADTEDELVTEEFGIRSEGSSGSTFRHIQMKEIKAESEIDASSVGVDTAIAKAYAYGIRLDNGSSGNIYRHIKMSSISSKADVYSSDESYGFSTAKAYAKSYGINLVKSDENRFEYIEVTGLTSEASATDASTTIEEEGTYGVYLENSSDNIFRFNVLKGGDYGVKNSTGSTGTKLHFNSIVGNSEYGVQNDVADLVNASLNWWGSSGGPDANWGGGTYGGGGDKIDGTASFSPWLADDPDADPDKAGVQLINPLPIMVESVGPKPTTKNGNTGYLDMAIWGAGYISVVGQVNVPHGTWDVKEPIGNNVELISEKGSTCHTCLEDVKDSEITIDDNDVTIGKLEDFTPRGFIVKDEVIVKSGVDSSTVHLNWNDIRNTVVNSGDGRLDAEYNWWGDLDPSDKVKGEVDYRPFLSEEPCSFTDYMEKHDIEDPRAAIAGKMLGGRSCSEKLPARLITRYGLKPREAEGLVDEYGCFDVRKAMNKASGNFRVFKDSLG